MGRADGRVRILFLCTGNSCRSQMAEGWARALKGDVIEAYSAGTSPHGLNPLAVRVMAEAGVDISGHASKRPEALGVEFDVVVTVCDSAHESCPVLPGAPVVHKGFDDPPRLARDATSEDEALAVYRRVRDEIRAFVETLPGLAGVQARQQTTKEKAMTNEAKKACCTTDCCGGDKGAAPAGVVHDVVKDDAMREKVREGYAKIAQTGSWSALQQASDATTSVSGGCCGGGAEAKAGGGCCGPATFSPEQLAAAIGYSQSELLSAPDASNMGLSCGNPTALASLRTGEVVVDLGSGGGFDCFIAGPKVGASGRVIGVDMTPSMVTLARKNIGSYTKQTGLNNVEFRLGEIENLPVADASADVLISNCVLNLSPEKGRVWKEIARVLKPGGRVAVSDLALLKPLPAAVMADVEALVGCVSGAVLVEESRAQAAAAGLVDIALKTKPEYIDAMTNWEDPLYQKIVAALPAGSKPSDYITSLDITARKR